KQIANMALPFLQYFRMGLKQHGWQQNEIVEVHRIERFEIAQVQLVKRAGEYFLWRGGTGLSLGGRQELIFPAGDERHHQAQLIVIGSAFAVHQFLQERQTILVVENGEGGLEPE